MKYTSLILLLFFVLSTRYSHAQNTGINYATPRFPLSFNTDLGKKIALFDDGNAAGDHYGLGIQSGLLQIFTRQTSDAIAMGYGSSNNFTENFRFKNTGSLGIGVVNPFFQLEVKGQANINGGAALATGMFFNNRTNTNGGFIGAKDNISKLGFFSFAADWGLGINMGGATSMAFAGAINNNNYLKAALNFPPTLGKKISLYPGLTGDVGLGVAGNRLQIYADNPNADVAIGYNNNNVFEERFAIKPNGSLAIMGNTGTAGQYIFSNGPNAPAQWKAAREPASEMLSTSRFNVLATNTNNNPLPGLAKVFSLPPATLINIEFNVEVETVSCAFCGPTIYEISIDDNDPATPSPLMLFKDQVENGRRQFSQGQFIIQANNATQVNLFFKRVSGPAILVGAVDNNTRPNFLLFEPLN